jgi:hypothetical protein
MTPTTTTSSESTKSAPSPASPFPVPRSQSDPGSPMSTPLTLSCPRTRLPAFVPTSLLQWVPPERERQRERETVLRRKASGRKWLNTGSADPTTLGLKWQGVGDTQPTEGRQLTNSMLAAALASKTAAAEEQQLTKVVEFTKEDLDSFDVTGLRSTDFMEAGGSYFKPTASTAQILDNPRLADALMHKTEFTQQEWDAFGVHDLGMHHFVKSGDSYFRPAGTEAQADVRVLRPLAHYGDFGEDGRLKWGVGDEVVVGEALTAEEIAKDTEGTVLEVSAKGAKIAFREPFSDEEDAAWVPSGQFYRLYPLPSARDTPIQRMVKKGRLRRCDVVALILYTGV